MNSQPCVACGHDCDARPALEDLIDAISDELSYEVSKSPVVQRSVLAALDHIDNGHAGYRDAWWLQ